MICRTEDTSQVDERIKPSEKVHYTTVHVVILSNKNYIPVQVRNRLDAALFVTCMFPNKAERMLTLIGYLKRKKPNNTQIQNNVYMS